MKRLLLLVGLLFTLALSGCVISGSSYTYEYVPVYDQYGNFIRYERVIYNYEGVWQSHYYVNGHWYWTYYPHPRPHVYYLPPSHFRHPTPHPGGRR